MESPIYPCIWFNDNADQAIATYKIAFKSLSIISSNPTVILFEILGKRFMALNGGPMYKPNPSISFSTSFNTKEELDEAWNILIKEGQALMPLEKYPWSEYYGWLQDKYGVSWQLSLALSVTENVPDVFPSLLFTGAQNGKVEQAISFYTSLFENSVVEVISRYGAGEHDTEGNIKYSQFTIEGQRLSAMESSHNHAFSFSPGVSLVVTCETQEEIDYLWLNLTEGGREDRCGWCQDAFGLSWQVVPKILHSLMANPQHAPKVVDAFMNMTKFNIQALKDAIH